MSAFFSLLVQVLSFSSQLEKQKEESDMKTEVNLFHRLAKMKSIETEFFFK